MRKQSNLKGCHVLSWCRCWRQNKVKKHQFYYHVGQYVKVTAKPNLQRVNTSQSLWRANGSNEVVAEGRAGTNRRVNQ